MANLPNNQVFSSPDPVHQAIKYSGTNEFLRASEEDFLYDVIVSNETLKQAKKGPKVGAAGPYGLPALWLKKMCDVIKTPLAIILRKSIFENHFPSQLKTIHVIPVYKGKRNLSFKLSFCELDKLCC